MSDKGEISELDKVKLRTIMALAFAREHRNIVDIPVPTSRVAFELSLHGWICYQVVQSVTERCWNCILDDGYSCVCGEERRPRIQWFMRKAQPTAAPAPQNNEHRV